MKHQMPKKPLSFGRGEPVKHNEEAPWLQRVKEKLENGQRQENVEITIHDVKHLVRKMTNWKAPGPDKVQGFWFKRFTSLHSRLSEHLQYCLEEGKVPEWMTLGRTVLIQKDTRKGNVASNYRPIACLPLMWKLLTGIFAEKVYGHLLARDLLPDEQKGCRKNSRGTKDQLLIDRTILEHCRRKQRSLAMGWIDYRKAYDMVPHSWLIAVCKMVGLADNMLNLIFESMKVWKTELTACGKSLGFVDINRGIFQGDSLSPLLFVTILIPLSMVLKETDYGYDIGRHKEKINHLLFMDDLKLYGKGKRELDCLVQTVRKVSEDIGMTFGMEKCAIVVMSRGKMISTEGIELPSGERMKDVKREGYKYLGILQLDRYMNVEMKENIKKEYIRRTKLLLKSQLNAGNVVSGINAWAIGVVRYGAGVVNWNQEEMKALDIKTRKLMTMNGCLHPRSNVDRLYLPRNKGGRGLISVEECVESESRSLQEYVSRSTEWMVNVVKEEMGIAEVEEQTDFKTRKEQEKTERWHGKVLHGEFLRGVEAIADVRSWDWLRGGHLKKETESLICAAQDQVLPTMTQRARRYKEPVSELCRACGEKPETVMHIASGCAVLASKNYLTRHNKIGAHIHWLLLKKYGIPCVDKWYKHVPSQVSTTVDGNVVILWDCVIQTAKGVEHNRPDVVVKLKKEKIWYIIDFAVPMDYNVKKKEDEKLTNYMPLVAEVRKEHHVKTKIVPVIVGALGTIPKRLAKSFDQLGITDVTGSVQTAAVIGTAAILRRVLNL